jgi:SAM-dependent methyltransferase
MRLPWLVTYRAREAGFAADYTAHLTRRTRAGEWFLFRRIIPHTLARLRGPVVDFGCGVGEILARCPPGSIGLEVNASSVAFCRARGLDVRLYDPVADRYALADLAPGAYGTLLASHVLEHIPDTANVLRALLDASRRLRIGRVVIKVPGAWAFRRDETHVTFVDRAWLVAEQLHAASGFVITEISYYPIDLAWIGRIAPIHETIIVSDARGHD